MGIDKTIDEVFADAQRAKGANPRTRWEQVGVEDQNWYRQDLEYGPLSLCVDLWCVDSDIGEWVYTVNNGKRQLFRSNTPERAMASVDTLLAGHIRTLARVVANN